MTTYTDEVNIYNPDAISGAIDDAGNAYKTYITEVTSDGIMVAAAGKGTSNGSIVSTTTGWHLSDVLEWVRNGVSRFWIGLKNQGDTTPTVRIGKEYVSGATDNESHMELDFHSLKLIDKEGYEYLHVSDLRESDGYYSYSVHYVGDGTTTNYSSTLMQYSQAGATTVLSVTVNGSTVSTTSYYDGGSYISFNSAPSSGAEIVINAKSSDRAWKAYTFGRRKAGSDIGPGSFVMGSYCESSGDSSFAEGYNTVSSSLYSHAEGASTEASSYTAHAEGSEALASGYTSHAEGGGTEASGPYSHAQNLKTISDKRAQTAIGTYNKKDTATTTTHPRGEASYGTYALIVGNGTSSSARSNALAVQWDGSAILQGWAGIIQMFAGTTPPSGWLLCDGSAVSRTTYATLFAAIGTTWGAGDGSTTFNLPDLRGRAPIGAGTGSGLTARTLGGKLGSEYIQAHTHSFTQPTITAKYKNDTTASGSARRYVQDGTQTSTTLATASGGAVGAVSGASTGSAGNMQPSAVVNFIIHTGKTS